MNFTKYRMLPFLLLAGFALAVLSCSRIPRRDGLQTRDRVLRPAMSAEEVGFDQDRLDDLKKITEKRIANGDYPGAIYLIARHGRIVAHEALGFADVKSGRKLTVDTLCNLASNTKPITGTAVMQLWDEEKLRLDDPVSKFIPSFQQTHLADGRPTTTTLTIRYLLTHQGGVQDYDAPWDHDEMAKLDTPTTWTLASYVDTLAALPLDFPPGEGNRYSTAGTSVLARIVEVASGQSYEEYVTQKVLKPLQMKNTFYNRPEMPLSRFSWVHEFTDGRWNPVFTYEGIEPVPGGFGLWGTALDLAKHMQAHLNGGVYGGKKILSAEATALSMTELIEDTHQGACWRVGPISPELTTRKEPGPKCLPNEVQRFVAHGGAFGTLASFDTETDTVIVFFLQISKKGKGGTTKKEIQKEFCDGVYNAMLSQ